MARPKKDIIKLGVYMRLPPYIIEFLDSKNESRAVLIEQAICGYYGIHSPACDSFQRSKKESKTKKVN